MSERKPNARGRARARPPRMPEARGDSGDESDRAVGGQDDGAAAAAVVRLALFHEYSHAPLKRQAINAVIPKGAFNRVFARAQTILLDTFGMELVELRGRHKDALVGVTPAAEAAANGDGAAGGSAEAQALTDTRDTSGKDKGKGKQRARDEDDDGGPESYVEIDDDEDDAEPQAAGPSAQTPAPKTKERAKMKTGQYILRNALPRKILEAMSSEHPLPAATNEGDAVLTQVIKDDSGALIPWERTDPTLTPELLGIRTVVLCLILTLGRSVDDGKLFTLLRRLGLQRDTVIDFHSPHGRSQTLTFERVMDLWVRQGYFEKFKKPNTAHPEGFSIEWRWGSREAEFSENAALEFIADLFIDPDSSGVDSDDEDAEAYRRRRAENRPQPPRTAEQKRKRYERQRQQLRANLELGAGGPLTGDV